MRAEQLTYRLAATLSLLAVSGALFYRAVIFYRAPWAILGGLSAVFLALSIPWLLSALCGWNTWELHVGAVVAGFIFIPLGVILFAWLGADLHHATDFAQNAVPRSATVRTVTHTRAYAGDGSEIWTTDVSLALAQPVAGHHLASLQLPGQQVYYPAGQQLKVLLDPKAPGDAELAGAPGVPTALLVSLPVWGTASVAFGVFCIVSLCWRVLPGGRDSRQRPDYLTATWRSWAAWLPFFAITGISVYAVTHGPQWWLFLLPVIAVAMLGPVLPALRRYLDVSP